MSVAETQVSVCSATSWFPASGSPGGSRVNAVSRVVTTRMRSPTGSAQDGGCYTVNIHSRAAPGALGYA